ncbi:MAG: DUF262 domain-containing HNH endonuclease family protein [Chitinophagaceae bacterium]
MPNNQYTPATVGELKCSIPLYQRLFEWEEPQILQLLHDLYGGFKNNPEQPYYIGMLTAFKENEAYSLVDGQQRFTVLTLIAIVFDTDEWKSFVKVGDKNYRLSFFARKRDEDYLRRIFERAVPAHVNNKMQRGIETIRKYLENQTKQERDEFSNYIYNQATFFLSVLPKEYTSPELNRYFEAMNATGKGLENHEILKVELLRNLPNEKREQYTRIWNLISDMDKCLVRQRFDKNEKIFEFKTRQKEALLALDDIDRLAAHCNDFSKDFYNENDFKCIKDIEISNKTPAKQFYTRSERAILGFTDFLLQVLWLQLSISQREASSDFFNDLKLQENFKKYLPDKDAELFIQNLLKYRCLFDYYILRVNHSDQNNVSYFLHFSDDENEDARDNERELLQYQSMLYVSTTSHLWLTELFLLLAKNPNNNTASGVLAYLKNKDNDRSKARNCTFKYGSIDRYWFWRLDYFLWENRRTYFAEASYKIADNFVFKSNRSIEHIAPQQLQPDSIAKVSEEYMDCFGNLAMISSGQNSSLQNASYEIKRAHVNAFINGSKSGTIESLKMLKIYEHKDWNDFNVARHSDNMIEVLISSFSEDCNELIVKLEGNLITTTTQLDN